MATWRNPVPGPKVAHQPLTTRGLLASNPRSAHPSVDRREKGIVEPTVTVLPRKVAKMVMRMDCVSDRPISFPMKPMTKVFRFMVAEAHMKPITSWLGGFRASGSTRSVLWLSIPETQWFLIDISNLILTFGFHNLNWLLLKPKRK
jgi:hypothetical protein